MTPPHPSSGGRGAGFFVITVGCPKNEADSDSLTARLTASGHRHVDARDADVVIVNTCGFIDAAKEESIDAILAAADVTRRSGARLAVVGCLVSLYGDELRAELPEVDHFGAFDQAAVAQLVDRAAGDVAPEADRTAVSRSAAGRRSRPLHAFVKISDGCDRSCAFCTIPLIKGACEALPPDRVLAAAERALDGGARELVLVGQDTSRWSWPGYGGVPRLLGELRTLRPLWLRLLYLQPDGVDDALLEAVAEHAVPYLDIPLQHAAAPVLRRMRRGGDEAAFLRLFERARLRIPGVALRSTFLVGHPGETEADFEELVSFVREAGIALAGVFVFDPQDGTRAAAMRPRVPADVARRRAARLAGVIESAARPFWESLQGQAFEMLVERGTSDPTKPALGRICYQAPDVDGLTYASGRTTRRGAVLCVRPVAVTGYDLHATAERTDEGAPRRRDTP